MLNVRQMSSKCPARPCDEFLAAAKTKLIQHLDRIAATCRPARESGKCPARGAAAGLAESGCDVRQMSGPVAGHPLRLRNFSLESAI
jgi:hypothetical protein